ncbi:MAG TPA: multiheme c-type cytochrome, partial [Polyangiales bacterium]|nr:multiheme c-type cytochrome [Polyangiales bacterium]
MWFLAAALAACSGGGSPGSPFVAPDAGKPPAAGKPDAGKPSDAGAAADGKAVDRSEAGVGIDAAAGSGAVHMTPEQLRDPETCKSCHPKHYQEWSSSMHAYAAVDPVFIAMNKRGQRETNGALGDFCVKCHAPMAVADSLTKDGLNLAQLPDQKRGVSCYFCHNAVGVQGDHNGKLRIANDNVMRGPFADALESGAHGSAFTELFDDTRPEHNAMCGGCHDIVLDSGVELERTFREFNGGLYGQRPMEGAPTLESCPSCHMTGRSAAVAVTAGAPKRVAHEHLFPGIDVALTDFPNKPAMRSAVEDCQLGLASVAFFTLDVTPPNVFTFKVETNAGHNQPSGAAQD